MTLDIQKTNSNKAEINPILSVMTLDASKPCAITAYVYKRPLQIPRHQKGESKDVRHRETGHANSSQECLYQEQTNRLKIKQLLEEKKH